MLGNIEKDLRFRMVKLTSCYNAVLKLVLNEIGQPDLIEHVAAIPLYLEMGASSGTMLSFMEMGLSRITGRLLQDQAADRFMGVSAAQQWLRRRSLSIDPSSCSLPPRGVGVDCRCRMTAAALACVGVGSHIP